MRREHRLSVHAWLISTALASACRDDASPDQPATSLDPAVVELLAPASCDRCTEAACTPEDARACGKAAEDLRHARGVAFDLVQHGNLAERACVHGYGPACSSIAILYQDGLGGREHSDAQAATWHERGCLAGAGIGCFNLAMMIESGESGPADPERARPWYDKAFAAFTASCDAGEAEWCANLGFMYESGMGVPRDVPKAIAAYERGCPQHGNNCANLGLLKIAGEDTPKDEAGGRKLLTDACDAGSGWCCAFLGRYLIEGDAPIDAYEGVRRSEQGCDAKEAVACATLGNALLVGRGVARDVQRGMSLLDDACGLGNSGACRGVVEQLMRSGSDAAGVREHLDAACRIGDASSCAALGAMFANGLIGTTPDPERAAKFWDEACRRGEPQSCDQIIALGRAPDVIAARLPEVLAHACKSGVVSACTGVPATGP